MVERDLRAGGENLRDSTRAGRIPFPPPHSPHLLHTYMRIHRADKLGRNIYKYIQTYILTYLHTCIHTGAPLRAADDALTIDTSSMDVQDAFDAAVQEVYMCVRVCV
jgi:hypothetical protein